MALNRYGHYVTPEDGAMLRRLIGPDTELLWFGRPKQGLVLRGADVMFIPFSVLWGGVFLLFSYIAYQNRMHPLMLAAIGILALIGIYAMILRYAVDSLIRRHTYYALTPTEAVIISGVLIRKTLRIRLDDVDGIDFSEMLDESGTIAFGPCDLAHNTDISGIPSFIRGIRVPKFDLIHGSREVYELVMEAKNALEQTPVPPAE